MIRVALIAVLLAGVGIAVRAYDRDARGLDYDERTTLDFASRTDAEVFADYYLLRNVREPQRLDPHTVAMEDFRSFPAFSAIAVAVQTPDDHLRNIARLRWASIVVGGLAVPFAFLLGLRYGHSIAALMTLFALLHPAFQFHAQNIRFYSLLITASTGALAWYAWVMPAIPRWLAERPALGWLMVVASALLPALLLTIHIGTVFPLVAMVVLALGSLKGSKATFVLFALALLFAIVPLANIGHFVQMRAFDDKSMEEMPNSAGPLPGLASVAFNVGIGYCLLGVPAVLALLRPRVFGDARPILLGTGLAGFAMLGAFSSKAELLRADYLLGFFPLILLAAALQIRAMANNVVVNLALLTGLALLPVLPSFVSTFAIDGDRVDYPTAIRFLREDCKGEPCIVFADSPFSLDYLDTGPGPKPVYAPAKEAMSRDRSPYKRVYYILREVKGFRTDRFAGIGAIHGEPVAFIGKDRLDLRMCRLTIFRQVR